MSLNVDSESFKIEFTPNDDAIIYSENGRRIIILIEWFPNAKNIAAALLFSLLRIGIFRFSKMDIVRWESGEDISVTERDVIARKIYEHVNKVLKIRLKIL